jgi:haloalkane dehalogenase
VTETITTPDPRSGVGPAIGDEMTATRPAPTRFVDLGDARVPVWIEGSGPPVVFVHGWPLTGDTWRGVVDHLRADATCVTFDLPGAGRSEWSDERLTLAGLGEAVVAVVRSLPGAEPVVLAGHDSGGGLARMAAAALGDRVSGMVLGNTEIPHEHSWRFRGLFAAMRLPGAKWLLSRMLRSRLGRWLLLRDAVADRSRIASDLAPRYLDPLVRDPRRLEGALKVIDGARPADFDRLAELHPRITGPVRLVWGVKDPWFPLASARKMVGSFGGPCELVEVPDASLLVHEEAPARFADEVRAVLRATKLHTTT